MNVKSVMCAMVILVLGAGGQLASAQSFELHPYAGGTFSGDWRDTFQFKREGIYGVKGGWFVSDRVQFEGNLGYINHFQWELTDPKTRALIWEVAPSIHFFNTRFSKLVPYVSIGGGGVTGIVGDPEDVDEDLFTDNIADFTPAGGPSLTLEDRDTFFQFSYGGGVKGLRLWGPVGLRAEVRGRTMPNFFGSSITWLETTGGLTFTWGER